MVVYPTPNPCDIFKVLILVLFVLPVSLSPFVFRYFLSFCFHVFLVLWFLMCFSSGVFRALHARSCMAHLRRCHPRGRSGLCSKGTPHDGHRPLWRHPLHPWAVSSLCVEGSISSHIPSYFFFKLNNIFKCT